MCSISLFSELLHQVSWYVPIDINHTIYFNEDVKKRLSKLSKDVSIILHWSILYDWCLLVHIILHFFKRIRPRIYLCNFAAKNKLWKYDGRHNTLSRVYAQWYVPRDINHTIYFNEDVKKRLSKLSKDVSIHSTLKKKEVWLL